MGLLFIFCSQEDRMSKAKVSDILSEIFKKIGSKENTKEVSSMKHFKIILYVLLKLYKYKLYVQFKRYALQMYLNL